MSNTSLAGRWAVITGADSGIGLAFSRELARRGMKLLMVSNHHENLRAQAEAVSREFNVQTQTLTLNLCRPDAATELMHHVNGCHTTPLLLVNNAGIFSFEEVCHTSPEKINAFIDLHVRTVTELSRLMAIRMKEAGEGYILNMSSMACWTPMPGIAMYAATKAYIRVFSRALACEMLPFGVRITAACPGGIATNLFGLPEKLKRLAIRIGALQTPERFVQHAVRHLLRGRHQYINGMLNRIGILTVAAAPTSIRMLVKSKMLDRGIRR